MRKRVQIIHAALELFSTVGYDGTSLSNIANRVGTNKQLITHHFGTKEKLWQEIVDYELEDGIALLKRVISTEKTKGPEHALRQFIEEYVHWASKKNAVHRLMFLESQIESPRLDWFTTKHILPSSKIVTRLIKHCQKAGFVKPGHTGRMYFTMLHLASAPFIGARQYKIYVRQPPTADSEIQYLRETIFAVLGMSPDE